MKPKLRIEFLKVTISINTFEVRNVRISQVDTWTVHCSSTLHCHIADSLSLSLTVTQEPSWILAVLNHQIRWRLGFRLRFVSAFGGMDDPGGAGVLPSGKLWSQGHHIRSIEVNSFIGVRLYL